MSARKHAAPIIAAAVILALLFAGVSTFAKPSETASGGNEFDQVCRHLKTKYKAEKVKIPFMWLARFAVGIVRPAGVKSFKVTIFRGLQFSPESLNDEMKLVMRDAFSEEWSPILRVRSQEGSQVYMNMRETGDNVKILLVTIQNDEAVVVRAKFHPEKLAAFIDNPKIFGISLDDGVDSKKIPSEPDKKAEEFETDGN